MTTYRTGKADYNALCDVCGFKKKASQLKLRWDGFMVCEEDWEPRNILDFYRTRNDAHMLPFTRPDDNNGAARRWIPTIMAAVSITGTYTADGTYTYDSSTRLYTCRIQVVPTSASVTFAGGASAIYFSSPFHTQNVGTSHHGTVIGSKTGMIYTKNVDVLNDVELGMPVINGPAVYVSGPITNTITFNETILISASATLLPGL